VKERLTGAIILVALLVLLVPELLTGPGVKPVADAAGAEGAQLRQYTIDLQDDAANRQPPAAVPATAVADDPVGQATPEAESESPPVAELTPPVDEASRGSGRPMGSGADASAAATSDVAASEQSPIADVTRGTSAPPSAADDKPRSAFGPNAVTRTPPAKPASAAPKPDISKSEALKADAAKAGALKAPPPKPEPPKSTASKGWAVQLGVFGSRDNAERLAKQVKSSGFPVVINETTRDGKKLYWVRVGPEAEQAGAVALGAKLKAAGHKDARVVSYP
jgi:DedD protein